MKSQPTEQTATETSTPSNTPSAEESSSVPAAAVVAGVPTKKKSTVVNINIGPLSINEHSFKFKPKFDFGAQIAGTGINFGLGDVRDGINIGAHADLTKQTVKGGGKNMEEFLHSLEFEGRVAEILNERVHFQRIIHFFTNILAETSKRCKIGNIHVAHVDGHCTGTIGTSAGAGISLGWKDEEGYRMMGASGTLVVGGEYRVGVHESRQKIKTIFKLALGGASFRFVLYVRRKETDVVPAVAVLPQANDGLEAECAGDMVSEMGTKEEEVIVTEVVRTQEEIITVIPSTVESAILGTTGIESEKKRTKEGTVSEMGTKEVTSTSSTVESARSGGKGGIESENEPRKEITETRIPHDEMKPNLLKEVGDNVTTFLREISDALGGSKQQSS